MSSLVSGSRNRDFMGKHDVNQVDLVPEPDHTISTALPQHRKINIKKC